jgi:hypothetical protein
VQAAPLSELRQGLGVRVKDFTLGAIGGVKRNFGGVEHFIRGVKEILGGLTPLLTPPKSAHGWMNKTIIIISYLSLYSSLLTRFSIKLLYKVVA